MSEPMQDPVSSPPPHAYIPPAPTTSSVSLSENIAAFLAYITVVPAIVFLVLEPYNRSPLVRLHSFQSIALCVTAILLECAVTIAEVLLHFIPGIWLIFGAVHMLLGLGLFVAWVIAMIKAYQGEWFKLPVIGDWADQQARD